jgi:nitrogenase-associated protein
MNLTFYHKPGCINNEKQKKILRRKGFQLDERNLLEENWDKETLEDIFRGYLVSEWFNTSAPKVKEGLVDPEALTFDEAIELFIQDPILMRRPIIKVNEKYIVGFAESELEKITGVSFKYLPKDIETCARQTND